MDDLGTTFRTIGIFSLIVIDLFVWRSLTKLAAAKIVLMKQIEDALENEIITNNTVLTEVRELRAELTKK